jgi:hypothetical protein
MSLADDLLNVSSNGVNSRLAIVETEPHIVIGDDRFITVPDELKRVAVQYDHKVETVTFDCPRYWDGYDMSKMKVYINYIRADELLGMYLAENVIADEKLPNIMHFDWTLTRNVTGVNGPIVFLVCVKRVDRDGNEEIHWNSEKCIDMYVSEGLEGDVIQDLYPDIFTQMLQKMDETVEKTQAIKDSAIKETTKIKEDALIEVTNAKETALIAVNNVKETALITLNSVSSTAIYEVNLFKDSAINAVNNVKNTAISDITSIKDKTVTTFNENIQETRALINEARDLVDETQLYMDETNELHNETLEWVKEVTKIATPEAMKDYTTEYFEENPLAILDAIDDIYSLALDSDIDAIIAGKYKSPPDAFEEEFSLATNPDIDAILAGNYVEMPDSEGGSGDDTGDDNMNITDEDIEDIVDDLFDGNDGENDDIQSGSNEITEEDLDDIVSGTF